MTTWTGSESPLKEGIGEVNILDLVMHMGRESRWGGVGSREYKVGHHSRLVSLIWIKAGFPLDKLVYAQIHDDHESYTGDIPRPVKRLLGDKIKELERHLDGRIYAFLGIPPPDAETLRLIKICDNVAMTIEAPLFGPPGAAGSYKGSVFLNPDVPEELVEPVRQLTEKIIPDFDAVIRRRNWVGDR